MKFRYVLFGTVFLLLLLLLIYLFPIYQIPAYFPCPSNLRQGGMGLHVYHDINENFPAGTIPNKALPPEKRLSWIAELLPFIECGSISGELDLAKAWDDATNQKAVARRVRPFYCGSSPNRDEPGKPSLTHYVGIAGVGKDAALLPKNDPRAGFFGYDRVITMTNLTDGSSTTLMVVETMSKNGPWAAGGAATVRGLDPDGRAYFGKDAQFGGPHSAGNLALFADGSVRLLDSSIDPRVFEALATFAGGEKPGTIPGKNFPLD